MYCVSVCAIIEQQNINHFVLYFMKLIPIKIEWLALYFALNLDASHHKMESNWTLAQLSIETTFHFFWHLLLFFFIFSLVSIHSSFYRCQTTNSIFDHSNEYWNKRITHKVIVTDRQSIYNFDWCDSHSTIKILIGVFVLKLLFFCC